MNVPQQLYDEAAQLNAQIYGDWTAWEKVISWADRWIERLCEWPDELTEISLDGRHKDSQARAALAVLAQRGTFNVANLIEQALMALQQGKNPFEIVANLYPLTYDRFSTGGLEFALEVPESIRTAIYKLDYLTASLDPEYGWADTRGKDAESWLQEEIWRELTEALIEASSS